MNQPDSAPRADSYSFLDFTIDLATERLVRGSTEIKLRPKSFQVMRCLIERRGRLITRDELLEAVWGDVAVTEESVTKCIAEIRNALEDQSQQIIRTVPRRGFLFQADVRQGSPSLVAQAELSATEPAVQLPSREPGRRAPGRRREVLVAAMVISGLAISLIWLRWPTQFFRHPAFEAIAVLPFENLSEDADQKYMADGLTEALITSLGEASPLRVIARTSVNQYRGTKKPIREIAREMNVDVLVEGTITQSKDRVRVTANLIQVSPEKHIWARTYERNLLDILELQSEIAKNIFAEIQGKLTPPQSPLGHRRPVHPEAQLAYWKASYFLNARRDLEAARKSVEYAEQAVRIDPAYAPAHTALALSYAALGASPFSGTAPGDAMPRAKEAAERAIALDGELALAHAALSYVLLGYYWDWAAAEREARRALELNPSDAYAHDVLGIYLSAVGRLDEAVIETKRARELDPASFLMNRNVGRALYLARRYDEALAELRQAGDMQPNTAAVDNWIVKTCVKKGLAEEAVNADLRVRSVRDSFNAEALSALRTAYSQKGLQGYWMKLKELVLPKFASSIYGVYYLAEISAYLGESDEAFRWLEKAYEGRPNWMVGIKVDPSFDSLRSDPRFSVLLRRMGLTP